MVTLTYSGDITKLVYDKVVDLEKIEFTDKTAKTECFVEVPRLDNQVSFQDKKNISVTITDEEAGVKKVKNPSLIYNSVLYTVKKTTDEKPKDVVQFSAGGLILILKSDKQTVFRLKGNRNYKILIA